MNQPENNIDKDTLRGFNESPKIKRIICETQGSIFRCANELKLDMDVFAPKYMMSNFCERNMDIAWSYFQMADAEECLDFILPEIEVPKLESPRYNSSVIEWVGYMYRYLYYGLKKTSKEIIKKVPFNSMLVYYPGLHTEDEDMAVDIIRSDNFKESSDY